MRYLILLITINLFIDNIYALDLQPFGTNCAIVINNDAILFEKPDINSMQIIKLFYLQNVYIIEKTNIQIDDSKNIWYYVDSNHPTNDIPPLTLHGWVRRDELAGKNDFTPVNKIQGMVITVHLIDSSDNYSYIYPNGTYKLMMPNSYELNIDKSILSGKIYKYKNIILLGESFELYYYDNDGNLKSPYFQIDIMTNRSEISESNNIYTLTGDNVNVRAEAATNGAVLLKLSKGAKVTLLKRSDIALTVGDKKGFSGVCGYRGNQQGWGDDKGVGV